MSLGLPEFLGLHGNWIGAPHTGSLRSALAQRYRKPGPRAPCVSGSRALGPLPASGRMDALAGWVEQVLARGQR